ncbi:MAG: ATP-dependent Clp protease ATP-binding subunit [Deltaproteobacteria bacterium]|nr:ATP-dependent Clp protease ATP-binding subunit [Deltaproteobacteria bacterium]
MNINKTTQQLLNLADNYAVANNCEMHTGHLLLAILTQKSVASKTLTMKGLTETALRGKLRDSVKEPKEIFSRVYNKAEQIASSFKVAGMSDIHLLAAIATVSECQGYIILSELGFNNDIIRNTAMHNMMSGFTREQQSQKGEQLGIANFQDAPTRPYGFNSQKSQSKLIKKEIPKRLASSKTKKSYTMGNVGKQIEEMQKKTLVSRITPKEITVNNPVEDRKIKNINTGTLLTAKEFPIIFSLGRNLTLEYLKGDLKPIVGRTLEMDFIGDILGKKRANTPCLTGPAGVGKTAIIEGLACELANNNIPGLDFNTVIEVTVGNLLGGTSLRGELGEKVSGIIKELQKSEGQILLFFDDVENLLSNQDAKDGIAELKEAMEKGALPSVFCTTPEHFARHFEASLARLVTPVEVKEPSIEESIDILKYVSKEYALHHNVLIPDETITYAVKLSSRYMSDSALPDIAISLIDLAGAKVKRNDNDTVTVKDIAGVVASRTGIPRERLEQSDTSKLLNLETTLKQSIIGHTHVLTALGETLRRNAAGFRSGRPIGSFLFLGPTGVGKTETAKALTKLLFGDEKAMIRLDMSEFSEAHAVARLLGAPPGYVGHEDGGQLTDAVKKRPYALILLDEIEKAHLDVVQSLLQVLDDGRMTDGKGKTIDFTNTVIIMTSNLGSDLRRVEGPQKRVGFGAEQPADTNMINDDLNNKIFSAARAALPPELWNRIDEPLVFSTLTSDDVAMIAKLMLDNLSRQIKNEKNINILIDDAVIDYLVECGGYDVELGARPMRRTISKLLEAPLARIILERGGEEGTIEIKMDGDVPDFFDITDMIDNDNMAEDSIADDNPGFSEVQ